jgi:hypothetical protein
MRNDHSNSHANGRIVLAATILGSSMAFIDGTVVNVALPALQNDLHASITDLQWIVKSYALFLAALLLVGGSLGDNFGRRHEVWHRSGGAPAHGRKRSRLHLRNRTSGRSSRRSWYRPGCDVYSCPCDIAVLVLYPNSEARMLPFSTKMAAPFAVALLTAALSISQTAAPASTPRNTLADYEPDLVKKIQAFGPLFSGAIPLTNTETAAPHNLWLPLGKAGCRT